MMDDVELFNISEEAGGDLQIFSSPLSNSISISSSNRSS